MAPTKQQLLATRKVLKGKKPSFIRDGYGKRMRIDDKWRKPKGRHSKQRHGMAGHSPKVKPGYRTDVRVRGLHQTGVESVVVNTMSDILKLTKGTHGAIIGGNVGDRKRLMLIEAVKKHGVQILNLKDNHAAKIAEKMKHRVTERQHRQNFKSTKAKKEVKVEKKPEMDAEAKAAKEKEEKDRIITKGN